MKCEEVRNLFAAYPDMPYDDPLRDQIEKHVIACEPCAEEFNGWNESSKLIMDSSIPIQEWSRQSISSHVMDRIYAEEPWRIPIHERIYSISYTLRRNLTAIIAFCLTLFLCSFVYSAFLQPEPEPVYTFQGIIPVASAFGETDGETAILNATMQGVPVASISEPFILGLNPIETYPDYLVVVSLLGIVFALLIMNWFSRIKI